MPRSALPSPARDPVLVAALAIAAITTYRVALLPLAGADLFVDEAQYWLWSRELAWGYYSKPPLIAWVIRGVTGLAGSDAPFWIRLPGPLLHAATGLLMIAAARRVTGPVPAAWVGVAWVTMPAVALGSLLFSTDTVLMPFFAAAVWAWLGLVRRRSGGLAVVLGLCVGLGLLAKYAALYFPLCAGLAAMAVPQARIAWRDAGIAAAVAAAVFAPNLAWNLGNDLTTLSHTADNIDWLRGGIRLNPVGMAEFVGSQLAVMGPVLFPAYLWLAMVALRRGDWRLRWLVWMSAPILLLVTGQALLSRAYGNWAATAYVGAQILTVPLLWAWARWLLWLGLAMNLALTLALPLAATRTADWSWGAEGRLVLGRYTGRAALSRWVLETARAEGLTDIVGIDREVLADLVYTGRTAPVSVFALPVTGRAPHYYAQTRPYPPGRGVPALLVTLADPPVCTGAELLERRTVGPGAYFGKTVTLYRVPSDCWAGR